MYEFLLMYFNLTRKVHSDLNLTLLNSAANFYLEINIVGARATPPPTF